jgi:hypothetical protein
MARIKELCKEAICEGSLGVVQGVFGISLFTAAEAEEINALKALTLSVMKKAPEVLTAPIICEGIRNGQKATLDTFTQGLSPESIAADVVVAAQ